MHPVYDSNYWLSAGVDYLTFLEPEHMEQIPRNQDSSSTSINIPIGLPFENSIQTTAFVSEKYLFSAAKVNLNMCLFVKD